VALTTGVRGRAHAAGGDTGIVGVTHGEMDLRTPSSQPEGARWDYQISLPFQVAPRLAGLFTNIRIGFAPGIDFENGGDAILFDDLANVDVHRAVPIARNQEEVTRNADPPGSPSILVKYISRGGFVPHGAKRADGSSHSHAGTGFAMNQSIEWPKDPKRFKKGHPIFPEGAERVHHFEVQQLAFAAGTLKVVSTERIENPDLYPGWIMLDGAMTNAIPDGDDLLLPITGRKPEGGAGSGVMRWTRTGGAWKPTDFDYITQDDGSCEASLIRDMDGALLFSSRGVPGPLQEHIRIWRAETMGAGWELVIDEAGIVPGTPITLNQAADGTPYIAANRRQAHTREILQLWPVNDGRDGLDEPLIVRACQKEFGPAPSGTSWNADHPSATTVQLGDGEWHNVLGFRILDRGEITAGHPPTPHTGGYIEEVLSRGPTRPVWLF
jgi:hypothetical protein